MVRGIFSGTSQRQSSSGAAAPYSELSLPQAAATNRDTENSFVNACAQRQFDQLLRLASGSVLNQHGYETHRFRDPATGRACDRYFRISPTGGLEEYRRIGTNSDGTAESSWVANQEIALHYFAAGKLYDQSGNIAGDFGINSRANLSGHRFLQSFATLAGRDGKLHDYHGKTLSFDGGAPNALVLLSPPPKTVATFERSVKTVLVDTADAKGFLKVEKDPAFEMIYRPRVPTSTISVSARAADGVFTGGASEVELREDGRIPARWKVARIEGDFAYLSGPEGIEQMRITRAHGDDGKYRYSLERKIHVATNWRSGGSLEYAKVGWVRDESFRVAPDRRDGSSSRRIAETSARGAPLETVLPPREPGETV